MTFLLAFPRALDDYRRHASIGTSLTHTVTDVPLRTLPCNDISACNCDMCMRCHCLQHAHNHLSAQPARAIGCSKGAHALLSGACRPTHCSISKPHRTLVASLLLAWSTPPQPAAGHARQEHHWSCPLVRALGSDMHCRSAKLASPVAERSAAKDTGSPLKLKKLGTCSTRGIL